MSTNFHEDLDWFAFLYIADEMPAEQHAAFETLLGEDQSAREAVARSVELSASLAASYCTPLPSRPAARWMRHAGLIALGAAACLLLVFLVDRLVAPDGFESTSPPGSSELAIAWSQAESTWDEADTLAADEDLAVDSVATQWPAAEGGFPEDLVAPSWMTVAVTELAADIRQDESTPPGN